MALIKLLIQFSPQNMDQVKTCTLPWGANWGTWNEEEATVLWGRLLYDSHSQKAMPLSLQSTHINLDRAKYAIQTLQIEPQLIYTL